MAVELVAMADSDAEVASMKFLFSIGMVVVLTGAAGAGAWVEVNDNRL